MGKHAYRKNVPVVFDFGRADGLGGPPEKVTDEIAFQAAMLMREGFTQESVAKRVGVGEITLNRALRRRGWKDANGDIVIPYDIFVRFGGYENALKRQQWRGA